MKRLLQKRELIKRKLKIKNKKNFWALWLILVIFSLQIINIDNNTDIYFFNEINSSQKSPNNNHNNHNNPNSSDVSGSDLYSEQISVYLTGGASLIRQSFVTNDSNVFKSMDFNDPGFIDCSLMIAASNGITPKIFPKPVSNTIFSSENLFLFEPFFGFLYYNNSGISNKSISERAQRAFNIIKNAFDIQIIHLETEKEDNYFFPFIGYYPNWETMINIMFDNAPNDGYWGSVDTTRLKSKEYLENNHLSSVILMLDSINLLYDGINLSRKYFDFDITEFSLTFMESSGIMDIFSSTFGIMNIPSGAFTSLDVNSFLSGSSKILISLLHYEGNEDGIERLEDNSYEFNLFKALNYNYSRKGSLEPSEKIYISLIGAIMTEIDISVYSADIMDYYPLNFELSDNIIETVEEASFLIGEDLDLGQIENYSIASFWETTECISKLSSGIQNLEDQQDIMNLLSFLSFGNAPMIPTGILNPIDNFIVKYAINNSEPILKITKEYINHPFDMGIYGLNVTVQNKGNITVYGKEIPNVIDFDQIIQIPSLINTFIQEVHPEVTPREFLSTDVNPRFFLVDTYGTGLYDTFYPNLNNTDALTFYNPVLAEEIMNSSYNYFFYSRGISEQERQDLADQMVSSDSVMNPNNWKLDPGEGFNYTVENTFGNYSFKSFDAFNFTINADFEPLLSYGTSSDSTNASNAQCMDLKYWNITSEQIGGNNYIQSLFSFKNSSNLDLTENNIDRIQIQSSFLTNISDFRPQLEFFNYSIGNFGNFQTIPQENLETTNVSLIFSAFTNFSDYVNFSDNNPLIFKITLITDEPLYLSLDCINLTIADRVLTQLSEQPAKVAYLSFYENNTYRVSSNDFIIITDHAPMLICEASLERYNSFPGEINTYYLDITNVGDETAKDVNISIQIPGKIYNAGNFTIGNGVLEYNVSSLISGDMVELMFEFYTPNSMFVPRAKIEYNNFKIQVQDLEGNFKIVDGVIQWGSEGEPSADRLSINESAGEIQVISEQFNHKNVVEINDTQINETSSLVYSYLNNISSDSIEFWATLNSTGNLTVNFYDFNGTVGPNICFNSGIIGIFNGSTMNNLNSYSTHSFSHLRIEFNCSTGVFNLYINGENFGTFNFLNNIANITGFSFLSSSEDEDYSIYIDAIGIESLGYEKWGNFNTTMGKFVVYSNDLFLSAPIDYSDNFYSRKPNVDLINIYYETNYSEADISGGLAPSVGDLIELKIIITNMGTTAIDDLDIIFSQYIKGFMRLSNNTLNISNLPSGLNKSVTVILNKTEYNAFFYDRINVTGNQYPILRSIPDRPILLGYKSINISKSFTDMDGEQGNLVTVFINVTNVGNILFKNITVNDISGFPKAGFILFSGVINKVINTLEPGESYIYSYKIKCNQQGYFQISSAKIEFDYLYPIISESNILIVKVRNNWFINASYIIIPGLLGFLITAGLYLWKNKYDLEAAEFERREELIFGTDYSSSWDKFIIEEHLQDIMDGKDVSRKRKREEVF
ncbi:MAG: hypothetical protein ACTSWY_03055 [Promethearchaeota archaeon]